jgi:hypothetical protein
MDKPISWPCPICQKNAPAILVQALYFDLLENKANLSGIFPLSELQKKELFRFLQPPQLERRPVWHILNPDIFFGSITFITLITAFYLYNDQQSTWLNPLYLLAVLSLFYIVFRKRLMREFTTKNTERLQLMDSLSKKADLWSSAYYCFQDDIVFHPESGDVWSPADFHFYMNSAVSAV